MYLAHASTPSTEPWNKPGLSDDPVSAVTVTVIVVGLTPISLAVSCVVLHASDVVGAVDPGVIPPPIFLPLPHPAASNAITSRTPSHRKRFNVPPRCRTATLEQVVYCIYHLEVADRGVLQLASNTSGPKLCTAESPA